MAAITPLVRLLPLLLLLLHGEYLTLTASRRPNDGHHLHPIVLIAGKGCSDLEARLTEAYRPSVPRCGAMKGKGWFGLWQNVSDLVAHDYVRCFEEQMRLVYDPAIDDYRNLPGVETRVPKFGSARAFHDKNPLTPKECLDNLKEALEERLGYRDGDTRFGAPYDWRYAPPIPGQTSRAYSHYFKQLKALVEAASNKHQKKKVIIFGHSYGGMAALEFVRSAPLAWRTKYIKHLILAAPTLSQGFVSQLQGLLSKWTKMIYLPDKDSSSVRKLWLSLESAIADLPSPEVFGHEPIVLTQQRNYSAYDIEDLLAAVGLGDGVIEPFRRRMVPKMRYFEAPMVPTTCINGVGNRTPRQLVFRQQLGDYDDEQPPQVVYGDGDEAINLVSMEAFEEEMRRQPWQRKRFKSVKVHEARHSELVTAEWALKKVLPKFLKPIGSLRRLGTWSAGVLSECAYWAVYSHSLNKDFFRILFRGVLRAQYH